MCPRINRQSISRTSSISPVPARPSCVHKHHVGPQVTLPLPRVDGSAARYGCAAVGAATCTSHQSAARLDGAAHMSGAHTEREPR